MAQELDLDEEPLGYQHFLCDVNIEYSPGGNRNYSSSNKQNFKLKYLPYMVSRDHFNKFNNSDIKIQLNQQQNESSLESSASSARSSICCDQDGAPCRINLPSKHVDVSRATCAFLGNSDYVPNHIFNRRHVVLELISAKLSQSTVFNVPPNSSYTNLVTLNEQQLQTPPRRSNVNRNRTPSTSTVRCSSETLSSTMNISSNSIVGSDNCPSTPPSSSKRYVNYTILIKTTPGLDKYPALIERRFSDFLQLYQGLKSQELAKNLIDKYVTFPKKVYMGNFLLTNIAERSIEFSRLLNLCMTNIELLWSVPFISFLLDKELKEAHKLSLLGDPDDVQVLVETSYYIEKKLYLSNNINKTNHNSSLSTTSLDSSSGNSSGSANYTTNESLSPRRAAMVKYDESNNYTGTDEANNESSSAQDINSPKPNNNSPTLLYNNSPDQSFCDNNNEGTFDGSPFKNRDASSVSALNQRLLVTFCMLFVTYYRGENYAELKIAVEEFTQMISVEGYVDSVINTRHYVTLKASLLFLMNMNRGGVIDENRRIWLKRTLEGIDGIHAEFDESFVASDKSSKTGRRNGDTNINGCADLHRIVTKGDLMSLIRDRNFCSFSTVSVKTTR